MAEILPQLGLWAWALLALGALFVGFSKTALPGISALSVAIFAAILPARASTAALLLLLLVGDAFALFAYRKHAHWPTLVRLIPAVASGLALGALFLALTSDEMVRRAIGAVLLVLIAVTVWQRSRPVRAGFPEAGRLVRSGWGLLAGFTTMVANAGGPVMSMYFLSMRFQAQAFLGTAAWFFAVVNLTKVPIAIGLGLIAPWTLLLDALLLPAVALGAVAGRWVIRRISREVFEWAVIVVTVLSAVQLLLF